MATRVTAKDVRMAFDRFNTAAKMAGFMPRDGYQWSMSEGDESSPYSLFWRDPASGMLDSAGSLPQYLGSNAREAWATLHSYAHMMFAMVNDGLLRDRD